MASSSSSLPRNWDHDVFPSFHGQDVRQNFLSHMLKEFRNKGINMFIDNKIERGESIGPELKRAIRGSKIAIVLLSERYASSSWCLDELVEIMNRELGQMVMTIFYKVNPTDVKKQRGDFGKVFEESCQGKNKEKTETWRQALEGVATIAGYHITNMDNEAAMIEEIAAHISNKLNIATPSGDFDRFIGMGAHMERLEPLLRLDLDEVRMIGIWGIYKVDFPTTDEAFQMFCMYAFDQKYPKDGYVKLSWEVTWLAGDLPLGLKVMGSYFRGMSKDEWTKTLPRLRSRLDNDIESVLKFSYDALDDEDKDLFLHIACLFNHIEIEEVAEYLEKRFPHLRQQLDVLYEKSLISMEGGRIVMHGLLVQLGRDIDRKQRGQRQFLNQEEELIDDDAAGRRSVIGINIAKSYDQEKLNINERAFEGLSNLQFLRINARLSHGLSYLSPKIRLLDWNHYPMTCLPSHVNVEFLVKLNMLDSKLEKLWEVIKSLRNLKHMSLSYSENLKELPNLSTAISLKELHLDGCKNLVELPSSIEKATNLKRLFLKNCSSLVKLPSCIGNTTNLQYLDLRGCSSLVELPFYIGNVITITQSSSLPQSSSFIGSAVNLTGLNFSGCSSLMKVPASMGNLKSLYSLDLSGCSSLKKIPEMSTNIRSLVLSGAAIEEVPSTIMRHYRLRQLILKGCKKLVSLPQLPESLSDLNVENCESLERLDCSFSKLYMKLNFANCFKLNKDARDLIIQSSGCYTHVLPGKEIPICFTHQANGGSLILKFNQRHFPSFLKIKACILLGCKSDTVIESWPYILEENEENDVEMLFEYSDDEEYRDKHVDKVSIYLGIRDKHNHVVMHTRKISDICSPLTEHLYICKHFFYFEEDVTSHELFFVFSVCGDDKWVIKRCGVNNEAKEEIHEANVTSSGLLELLTNDCGTYYGDCEAEEETNEADVTSPVLFFEFLTNEAGEDTNEGDCAERKKRKMDQDGDASLVIDTSSKYTSNSGAGCSKSMAIEMGLDGEKVLKAVIHEHAYAFLPYEVSDVVPSEVGINGDCNAEEDLNGNESAETKKRKRQSPFTFVDYNSTSEVGNNGNCEADEEVNGNNTAKAKKSRLSL